MRLNKLLCIAGLTIGAQATGSRRAASHVRSRRECVRSLSSILNDSRPAWEKVDSVLKDGSDLSEELRRDLEALFFETLEVQHTGDDTLRNWVERETARLSAEDSQAVRRVQRLTEEHESSWGMAAGGGYREPIYKQSADVSLADISAAEEKFHSLRRSLGGNSQSVQELEKLSTQLFELNNDVQGMIQQIEDLPRSVYSNNFKRRLEQLNIHELILEVQDRQEPESLVENVERRFQILRENYTTNGMSEEVTDDLFKLNVDVQSLLENTSRSKKYLHDRLLRIDHLLAEFFERID